LKHFSVFCWDITLHSQPILHFFIVLMARFVVFSVALLGSARAHDHDAEDSLHLLQINGQIDRAACVNRHANLPYSVAKANSKCPYQNANRLWRTGGTLEQCGQKCFGDPKCKAFSYGKHGGAYVCMGCTGQGPPDVHAGFQYYDVCDRPACVNRHANLPYSVAKANSKCPYQNANRLWRTGGTLEQCGQKCFGDPKCKAFSYGKFGGAYVCMGCTGQGPADVHDGFQYYDVCDRTEPPKKCMDRETLYPFNVQGRSNTKCPYQDESRLWRLEGQTEESCGKRCQANEECQAWSYASTGPFKGVCMGCTGMNPSHGHDEFKYYTMCVPKKFEVCPEEGDAGSDDCPEGCHHMTNCDQCKAAAKAWHKPFDPAPWPKGQVRPTGCFRNRKYKIKCNDVGPNGGASGKWPVCLKKMDHPKWRGVAADPKWQITEEEFAR